MLYFVFNMKASADRLPRFGERELIFLLSFTCYYVSFRRGFLFLLVLGIGYVILLWHSLGLPYNYFKWIYIVSLITVYSCFYYVYQKQRVWVRIRIAAIVVSSKNRLVKGVFAESYFHQDKLKFTCLFFSHKAVIVDTSQKHLI